MRHVNITIVAFLQPRRKKNAGFSLFTTGGCPFTSPPLAVYTIKSSPQTSYRELRYIIACSVDVRLSMSQCRIVFAKRRCSHYDIRKSSVYLSSRYNRRILLLTGRVCNIIYYRNTCAATKVSTAVGARLSTWPTVTFTCRSRSKTECWSSARFRWSSLTWVHLHCNDTEL